MSISEIDWQEVDRLSRNCRLFEYLSLLKRDQWRTTCPSSGNHPGYSLLHYAARKGNMRALYVLLPLQMYTFSNFFNRSPLHVAAVHDNVEAIEAICACQTSLISTPDVDGYLPLDEISYTAHFYGQKILVANGARLKNLKNKHWVTQKLREFESGVLQCRDVIVTLLGLKKKRVILHKLDRFLVQQELAAAIWSTRHTSTVWTQRE